MTKTKKVVKEEKSLGYNPSLKDFLKNNKDISVIGLWWAGYWRLLLIIGVIYFALILLGVFA